MYVVAMYVVAAIVGVVHVVIGVLQVYKYVKNRMNILRV